MNKEVARENIISTLDALIDEFSPLPESEDFFCYLTDSNTDEADTFFVQTSEDSTTSRMRTSFDHVVLQFALDIMVEIDSDAEFEDKISILRRLTERFAKYESFLRSVLSVIKSCDESAEWDSYNNDVAATWLASMGSIRTEWEEDIRKNHFNYAHFRNGKKP